MSKRSAEADERLLAQANGGAGGRRDSLPGSDAGNDDEEGGDFEDWGSEQEDAPIRSLLSTALLPSLNDVFGELKAETGFDFSAFASKHTLGTYDRLKLANYIRSTQLTTASGASVSDALKQALSDSSLLGIEPQWKSDAYLQPVFEDDGLVMAVLSAFDEEEEERDEQGGLDDDVKEALMAAAFEIEADPEAVAQLHAAAEAAARKYRKAGGDSSSKGASASSSSDKDKDDEIAYLKAQLTDMRVALVKARQLLDGSDDEGAETSSDSDSSIDDDRASRDKRRRADGAAAAAASASAGAGRAVSKAGKSKLSDDEGEEKAPRGAAAAAGAGASKKPNAAPAAGGTSAGNFGGILNQDNDSYYFDSYAKISIHADMLGDSVRTDSYRDAIQALVGGKSKAKEAEAAPAPVVLDVGCGTGVLSLFSAQAGASRVVAVDASNIIEDAREIAIANAGKGGDRITFLKGKAEQVPVVAAAHGRIKEGKTEAKADGAEEEQRCVDVLVSEWMGYALLFESMLSSVLVCRDRYLKRGGLMLPSKACVLVAGVHDPALWDKRVGFWDSVYGFNMRQMRRHLFGQAYVEVLPQESICTPHAAVKHLNLLTMRDSDQDIVEAPFTLTAGTSGLLHGLCLWFDIDFDDEAYDPEKAGVAAAAPGGIVGTRAAAAAAEASTTTSSDGKVAAAWTAGAEDDDDMPALDDEGAAAAAEAGPKAKSAVYFSTGPHVKPTHWAQTFFLFEKPLDLGALPSKSADGLLTMTRDAVNPREYRFKVALREHVVGGSSSKGRVLVEQSYHMG